MKNLQQMIQYEAVLFLVDLLQFAALVRVR